MTTNKHPRLRKVPDTPSENLTILTVTLAAAILIPFLLQLPSSGAILSFLPVGTEASSIAANLLTVAGILLGLSSMIEKQHNAFAALNISSGKAGRVLGRFSIVWWEVF